MKAITTRYLGATAHRPARILATDQDGNRITLPADGDFPYDDAHRAAAVALCQRMDWPGADGLVGGTIKYGRVWVFTHDADPTPADTRQAVADTLRRALDDLDAERISTETFIDAVALFAAPSPCGDRQPVDLMDPHGPAYRCRLPAGHAGAHVDTRHPMHPTWPAV